VEFPETRAGILRHGDVDPGDRKELANFVARLAPDAIVHALGGSTRPDGDPARHFDVECGGTFNLLEAARRGSPTAPLVCLSSRYVYGDAPDRIAREELPMRYAFVEPADLDGIPESLPVDGALHSPFGTSVLLADVLVREYARRYGMPACVVRLSDVAGDDASAFDAHAGTLQDIMRCAAEGAVYVIRGHRGKQVFDTIHAADAAGFIEMLVADPRPGEIYNLGGGRDNATSVLQAIQLVERSLGRPLHHSYSAEAPADEPACYYANIAKAKADYPGWAVSMRLPQIVERRLDASLRRDDRPALAA
jgi:CDP-paratose 2-epimerase